MARKKRDPRLRSEDKGQLECKNKREHAQSDIVYVAEKLLWNVDRDEHGEPVNGEVGAAQRRRRP